MKEVNQAKPVIVRVWDKNQGITEYNYVSIEDNDYTIMFSEKGGKNKIDLTEEETAFKKFIEQNKPTATIPFYSVNMDDILSKFDWVCGKKEGRKEGVYCDDLGLESPDLVSDVMTVCKDIRNKCQKYIPPEQKKQQTLTSLFSGSGAEQRTSIPEDLNMEQLVIALCKAKQYELAKHTITEKYYYKGETRIGPNKLDSRIIDLDNEKSLLEERGYATKETQSFINV